MPKPPMFGYGSWAASALKVRGHWSRGRRALAAAHEQRAATVVEVRLVERERLVDPKSGSPQHDDQTTQPASMAPVTRRAHDRDDLLHGRRIGRIALSLVTRRAATLKAGHGRRRPPTTGGVEQQLGHNASSGSKDEPRASRKSHVAEDIALDAQRESGFASVALAAAVLSGPSDLPHSGSGVTVAPTRPRCSCSSKTRQRASHIRGARRLEISHLRRFRRALLRR